MMMRTSGPRSPLGLTQVISDYDSSLRSKPSHMSMGNLTPEISDDDNEVEYPDMTRTKTFEIVSDDEDKPLDDDDEDETSPSSNFTVSVMGIEYLLSQSPEELSNSLGKIGASDELVNQLVRNMINMSDYFEVLLEILNLDELLATNVITSEMISMWLLEAIKANCFYMVRHLTTLEVKFNREAISSALKNGYMNPARRAIIHHLTAYRLI